MRVGYVIADWKTPRLAAEARASILARRPLADVVVVDAAGRGLNYSEALNAGAAAIGERADVYCYLNADVQMIQLDVPILNRFLGDPELGIVGPRQLNAVDRIAHGGIVPYEDGTEWDLHLRHRCWLWPWAEGNEADELTRGTFLVPTVSGSVLYARRAMVEQLGGWPEWMPFYYEETLLCYMARHAGWRVLYTGAVTWRHYGEGAPVSREWRAERMEAAVIEFQESCERLGIPVVDIPSDDAKLALAELEEA